MGEAFVSPPPTPLRSCHDQMEALTKLLEEDGGRLMMSFNGSRWVVGIEWGREDPDSDMVGAAAYGTDRVAASALEAALKQAGV